MPSIGYLWRQLRCRYRPGAKVGHKGTRRGWGPVRVKFSGMTIDMTFKQQHKTRWNGDKWHQDGLNTDRDKAYYSKCEMEVFEIQTRDICIPSLDPTKRSLLLEQRPELKLQWNNVIIFLWSWQLILAVFLKVCQKNGFDNNSLTQKWGKTCAYLSRPTQKTNIV